MRKHDLIVLPRLREVDILHITTSEIGGFGIGYSISRKYWPIRVSVSVSARNQNSGFGRSLLCTYFFFLTTPYVMFKVLIGFLLAKNY